MEAQGSLKRRVSALEAAVPGGGCQTCNARPIFVLDTLASPCAECGREPHTFTIAIDRAERRPSDAA